MPNNVHKLQSILASVVPILVTPFSLTGEIDYDRLGGLVERLLGSGVTVLTVHGNTGEFYALPESERLTLLARVAECVASRALLISGIGFDVATAIAEGHAAEAAGAQAVMVHQPVHPYQSARGWVQYHSEIAQALPGLGIIPYIRDASVSGVMLADLLSKCPNVIGIKYAVPNPVQFAQLVQQIGPGRLTWVCGLAESWAPFFWLGGARGFTSGLANVSPRLSFEMLEALRAGDFEDAMRVWTLVKPFEDLRARENNSNNIPVVKEALAQLGLCERTVRPPISELAEAERLQVRNILAQWEPA